MVNIKRIRIEGFRSLDNVDLELDGGAFITGMNGAGKSSVLEAIRFALLGYCQNTDRRGAGAKALIAHGAKEASIAIELLGGRDMTAALVRVVIPQEGAVRWNAEDAETGKPLAAKPEQLWPWMDVSEAALAAALMPAEHVTTQGFEGVLAEYQAGAVEPPVLYELCGKEHIEALLEDYPPNKDGSLPTQLKMLNGLRAVGEESYLARRETGRVVKALEAQIPAEAPKPPTGRNGKPLGTDAAAALKEHIERYFAMRDILMRELGEARQMAKVTQAGSVEELEAAIAAAQEASDKAAKVAEAAQAEHVRAVDALEAAKRARDTARYQAETIRQRIEELTTKIESYAAGRACETCGAKWTEARVRAATAKLREARMALAAQLKDAEGRMDEKLRADYEQLAAVAAQAEEPARESTKAAIAASADLANLRRELELAKRVSGVRSPEAVEADLLEIDEWLDRAKAAMGQLAKMAEYEAQRDNLEKERARYAELDWRVKAFRDGEVLNRLGADGLKAFEGAVNETLTSYGYAFGFEVDSKTVKVLMGRRDGALRAIERASSGERKLAEVAVALTFAAETGIALVDDLDHLDGKNRNQALSNIAHDVREGHSIQVIAAGAWGKASEPDPDTLAAIGRALEPLQPVWVCADSLKEEQEAVA